MEVSDDHCTDRRRMGGDRTFARPFSVEHFGRPDSWSVVCNMGVDISTEKDGSIEFLHVSTKSIPSREPDPQLHVHVDSEVFRQKKRFPMS